MQCSFEEQTDLPDGRYRYSKCLNRAEILLPNDPYYGLCFTCAYNKLQAENKKLKAFALKLVEDEGELQNLDYWAEEYLHAYEQLAGVSEIEIKREQLQAENEKLKEKGVFGPKRKKNESMQT